MARTNWPPKSAFGWALADAISAPRRAARPPAGTKGGDAAALGPRTEDMTPPPCAYDERTTMKAWECLLSGETALLPFFYTQWKGRMVIWAQFAPVT